jgi:hypothetical protein
MTTRDDLIRELPGMIEKAGGDPATLADAILDQLHPWVEEDYETRARRLYGDSKPVVTFIPGERGGAIVKIEADPASHLDDGA